MYRRSDDFKMSAIPGEEQSMPWLRQINFSSGFGIKRELSTNDFIQTGGFKSSFKPILQNLEIWSTPLGVAICAAINRPQLSKPTLGRKPTLLPKASTKYIGCRRYTWGGRVRINLCTCRTI